MNHTKSRELYARAKELMPGGVNSAARAFGAVGGEPIVIAKGEGAYLWDVDHNRYVDYIQSWGPMILGHGRDEVRAALHEVIDRGTSYGAPTQAENELAEMIVSAINSVEMLRLVNSGTEATMSAIRVARGFTGRELIVKFSGNYHGHVDSLLVAAGSAAATLGVPNSPGVTAGTSKDTIVLPYNDAASLEQAFTKLGDQIAGVIFEPVVGNMGCVTPKKDFVDALHRQTQSHGALLICDEVMTGFRVAYGGAQSIFDIEPDLTTMGKVVGGGLPLAGFGGKKEIMSHVLPAGDVFQAGTLSGNPVATAAGIATLKILSDPSVYDQLETQSARLEAGLRQAAEASGMPHTLTRVGSMMTLFFNPEKVTDWDVAAKSDTDLYAKYFWGMLERGIYLPCSQFEALFVSACLTDADIDATTVAATETLKEISGI